MVMSIKPDWDEYFIGMLEAVSARASCNRGRSAAILTRNNRIISTGYVGSPVGLPSCDEVGHLIELRVMENDVIPFLSCEEPNVCLSINYDKMSKHCVRTFHAEMNAILSCAKEGVSTLDATMYCTMVPCRNCAMAIIQAGIIRVVAAHPYQKSAETFEMFDMVKPPIELKVLSKEYLY
jgi:dCMP deaminase